MLDIIKNLRDNRVLIFFIIYFLYEFLETSK